MVYINAISGRFSGYGRSIDDIQIQHVNFATNFLFHLLKRELCLKVQQQITNKFIHAFNNQVFNIAFNEYISP